MAFIAAAPLRVSMFAASTATTSLKPRAAVAPRRTPRRHTARCAQAPPPTPLKEHRAAPAESPDALLLGAMAAALSTLLATPDVAHAVPEAAVDAFKSIPASLAHPTFMWLAVFTCAYTFYLGIQSRQVRSADVEQRKQLVKGKYGQRHFNVSSFLMASVTFFTFTGMANTYTRTGKLFPGPHLYNGLALVALLSFMASLVPYMQRGQDWARNAHFATAFVVTGLFAWQAKSGMDIVAKLLNWT